MLQHVLDLKTKLRNGGVVYGAWLTFNDVEVAEVLAGAGYDAILIDMEHTAVTLDGFRNQLAAIRKWNTVVLVRVPDHSPGFIKRVLDTGADGIIAPMTMDADQARALVAACRYAPEGRRSYGPRRATNYYRNADEYLAQADDALFIMPQIEHVDAADEALAIASVPGIDALCLGPMDLSATAGLLGQLEHPTIVSAFDKVFAAARQQGMAACMGFSVPPDEQAKWVAKGARFAIAGDDLGALRDGVHQSLAQTRERLTAASLLGAQDKT